ncbi:SMI1/KNR4 family protein [Dyella terrae]|uniref:SMI1/KNR4 family protein n=1 Tax=Dyella terrae TaxID=522259 RepID=UPI001EFD4D76|nr:SMI1/KNR4 family protein [Dyella terrae]ULU26766.1 SMI1-KNR4 cell-wall [Dyella terrae]
MLPVDAVGKVFRSRSGEIFGALRPITGTAPKALSLTGGEVFAEDDCGNYFLRHTDQVVFWDHEDGQFTVIADTFEQFLGGLEPRPVAVLKRGQVKHAWIDPAFAESIPGRPKEE